MQQEVSEWKDTMPNWHHHCQVGCLGRTGGGGQRGQDHRWWGAHQGHGCSWGRVWGGWQACLFEGQSGAEANHRSS